MRFGDDLYERIRPGCQSSAAVVAPLVYDLAAPRSVIDVGCGEGWWGQAFADLGAERVVGVEVETPTVVAPDVRFEKCDLEYGMVLLPDRLGSFDLAVCLEVAEHLTESASYVLTGTLCKLAPVILFSAAVPGQRGAGHLNEQWPAYWAERFEASGFQVSGELRWRIWDDDRVEPWYRQNLLVCAHRERVHPDVWNYLGDELFGEHAFDDPVAVAHPVIFGWRAEEAWGPQK